MATQIVLMMDSLRRDLCAVRCPWLAQGLFAAQQPWAPGQLLLRARVCSRDSCVPDQCVMSVVRPCSVRVQALPRAGSRVCAAGVEWERMGWRFFCDWIHAGRPHNWRGSHARV
eukprot:UN1752